MLPKKSTTLAFLPQSCASVPLCLGHRSEDLYRRLITETSNGLSFFFTWLSDTNQGPNKFSLAKHMFDDKVH